MHVYNDGLRLSKRREARANLRAYELALFEQRLPRLLEVPVGLFGAAEVERSS